MDYVWIALGIAIGGFFIGNGLKKINYHYSKNYIEYMDEEEEHELIKESEVHRFIGVTKKEAKLLLHGQPDLPQINLNGRVYFVKRKLRDWIINLGN